AASIIAANGGNAMTMPAAGLSGVGALGRTPELAPTNTLWFGYLWLLCGSAYFLVRCLLDLVLVRRPALAPNLNSGGLAWLGGALFICLATVAFRYGDANGSTPVALDKAAAHGDAAKVGKEPVSVQAALKPLPPWLMRTLAVLCHLAVAAGLVVIGCRPFQDAAAGMAAATFYLMLPYTGHHVGHVHHASPTPLLAWALAAYPQPRV